MESGLGCREMEAERNPIKLSRVKDLGQLIPNSTVILPPLVFPGLSIPFPISFRFLSAPFRYSTN